MGSGGHDIQRCCFLRPHLENTGPWRCSPAFPGDSLGSVCAGGWALRVHRFSKAFTKRRSVCFVCWAQSVYFVLNMRMSPPHLCSALGGGRRRLLQAVLHLLCSPVLLALASSHTRAEEFRGRDHTVGWAWTCHLCLLSRVSAANTVQ